MARYSENLVLDILQSILAPGGRAPRTRAAEATYFVKSVAAIVRTRNINPKIAIQYNLSILKSAQKAPFKEGEKLVNLYQGGPCEESRKILRELLNTRSVLTRTEKVVQLELGFVGGPPGGRPEPSEGPSDPGSTDFQGENVLSANDLGIEIW